MRTIDADALMAEMHNVTLEDGDDRRIFYEVIERQPIIEPERKTGWWLIKRFGADAQCSECGTYFSDAYDTDNSDVFCRHCGAKMDGLKVIK